jgi:uncharacterized protein YbjT (DUF2867 family)
MILVTGATGTIGSALVAQLSSAGHRVRALVRDRARAAATLGPFVDIVIGDLSSPESLTAAFRDIERAFVLTSGSPDLATLEGNAFRAAKEAGVRQIVKLSGIPVCVPEYARQMPLAQWHLDSEDQLRASGVPWTILRPSFFVSNIAFWNVARRGALVLPAGEGQTALIDPRDIAGAAARVLSEPGHDGRIYELTGPELLSQRELLARVSRALGQPLEYVDAAPDAWRAEMVGAGFPPILADSYLFYFQGLLKPGKMAFTRPALLDLLGRARTADEWIGDHLARLRA